MKPVGQKETPVPWTTADVDRHRKGLDPKAKALWVRIANDTLKRELAKGTDRKEAEARAIRAANKVAGNLREDANVGGKTELYKVRVRKATSFVQYRSVDVALTEGARAVIGTRADGSEALQSMEFDRTVWPHPDAAREWTKKNREQLEGMAATGSAAGDFDLSEDVVRPGAVKVDRAGNRLGGAKLLGALSKNGHRYSTKALQEAAELYRADGGVKVNLDHPDRKNLGAPRRVFDRWGKVDPASVRVVEGDGVYGDVLYNPEHERSAAIVWFAENMPDVLGFSHNGRGTTSGRPGAMTVESVRSIRHLDLVADPATTRGLYESLSALHDGAQGELEDEPVVEDGAGDLTEGVDPVEWNEVDAATLRAKRPDLVEKLLAESDAAKRTEAELKTLREERDELKKKTDEAEARERLAARREKAEKLIAEAKLPKDAVGDVFLEQLTGAKDDEAMKALVEDRAKLVLNGKPRSRERDLTEGAGGAAPKGDTSTSKGFAAAVRG